jgi:aminoglycoside phosphotransferase family enzyme/predicted kinase
MDSQQEVISFLSRGESYGRPGTAVERIETHISIIFLIGDRAYKLKRSVRFPYLDYSTVTLRQKFCQAELVLNRRMAPAIYLQLHRITREGAVLAFDGRGEVVDWVLEMHRFSQTGLFDRLAEARRLTPKLVRDLTDAIAAFHARAKVAPGHGGRVALEKTILDNTASLIQSCPPLDMEYVEALHAASTAKLSGVADLLDERKARGRVRRCHGDLHLRNICLFQDRPTLFDCIEFSDELSCIDVLYDLAFLLMDLVHRELIDLANLVFNRYLDLTADSDGLPALPLFMSVRSAVRAHVLIAQNELNPCMETLKYARSYLVLARRLLHQQPPRLIAIGGLSGTGKSTVAQALAGSFLPFPGARVIRSDVLRKRQFDVAPETRLPPSAYSAVATELVYGGLRDQAAVTLAAGYSVILDATFLREEERTAIAAAAAQARVPFIGLWLDAPEPVLAGRISSRGRDASDADTIVLQNQLRIDTGPISWRRLDSSGGMATIIGAATRAVIGG